MRDVIAARRRRVAAVIAAAGFSGLACFQFALAAGAPLGQAAWGGQNAHLTPAQRIASAGAVALWGAAVWIVLGRARVAGPAQFARLYVTGTWTLAVLCALSALVNLSSTSRYEQLLLAPLAFVLAALCVVVAYDHAGRRAGLPSSE